MKGWNWTPKAYRLRDNLIMWGCLAMWTGIVMWMFILATN